MARRSRFSLRALGFGALVLFLSPAAASLLAGSRQQTPATATAPAPATDPTQTAPAPAAAQPSPQDPPITPGELTRLFDAYAVLQAQGFLKLTDEQYGEFVVALKALQDVRRRHANERGRLINDLRKLTAPESTAPDALVRTTLEALAREDASADANTAKAYANLDEVLDLRQRARFRVFEEQIERQKLNLLSRVRRKAQPTPDPK
jgi:hypothetical protein